MRIAEIYPSLQGEGMLAGTPSVFVRTSGCNLRCVWCDTPFTSWRPEGREASVAAILEAVTATDLRHVVVTGGEPLVSGEIATLLTGLGAAGLHVTVETAGTVPLPQGSTADLVSISPKLGSSAPPADTPGSWRGRHEATRRRDDVLRGLMATPHQLKFVIDGEADFAEACRWLDDLTAAAPLDRRAVFMMPQGRSADELARTAAWLEPACRRAGLSFAPRHHIAWFGATRGT
jgi:7-carboxy-7-deazaguanine synthase